MKVLLAWELGSNWGHLAALLPLAEGLRARGHEVVFAVRNLDSDLSLLTAAGFDYLPMPFAIGPLQLFGRQSPNGYADVLVRGGFGDGRTLTQLVAAWKGILNQVRPGLVICKYAPLAEFATRDRPVMSIGTGFELPPLSSPLPIYGLQSPEATKALQDTEDAMLKAMKSTGIAESEKWEYVGQAFSHTQRVVLTLPELDHFGARADSIYLGAVEELGSDPVAQLKVDKFLIEAEGRCVFAYLRMGADWIRALVEEFLAQTTGELLIVVDPTLTLDQCDRLTQTRALVLQQPIDLNALGSQVDTFICHAGHGMVARALKQQKRLLMLPQYNEQVILAKRVLASQAREAAVAMVLAPQQASVVIKIATQLRSMITPILPDAGPVEPVEELVEMAEGLQLAQEAV
jgi:hypothetical protein